ncbi:MAG: hypothetical protein WD875_10265 [Pirellulales bacterium]
MIEKRRNHPLYFAVAALGMLFAVSACAYCVMSFRAARGGDVYSAADRDGGLMRLMRERGGTILAIEIAALAAASVAAMASDRRGDAAAGMPMATDADNADALREPPSTGE